MSDSRVIRARYLLDEKWQIVENAAIRIASGRIAEIDRAEVEESYAADGSTYRVVLVIGRGQSVGRHPLILVYTSSSAHNRAADAIKTWLEAGR